MRQFCSHAFILWYNRGHREEAIILQVEGVTVVGGGCSELNHHTLCLLSAAQLEVLASLDRQLQTNVM